MAQSTETLSLVADVGGTNTRVALSDGPQVLPDTLKKYRNSDYPDLETLIGAYLADRDIRCAASAVAIAGPVDDGKGTLTNLNWSIDPGILQDLTGAATNAVLNDLQAQAYGLGSLAPENLETVIEGQPEAEPSTCLVVGIGTGFNAAVAVPTPGGRVVPPSECGHVSMPIRTEDMLRLGKFVEREHGFASVEDVLSGRGLEHIQAWINSETDATADRTAPEIVEACAAGDPAARRAVETFVTLMGTVVGDLALVQLPFGGVYLVGGVSRAMQPYLSQFGFAAAFRDKGRFTEFMDQFPVFVVDDDFAALTGLAMYLHADD
ncbi:MAG: ROK family protein [Silicimonas sp.]|nr:ROK family protein [Silicimonas sp.]